MIGSPNSIFAIHFPGMDNIHMESIQSWMEKIEAFPICFCLQITDSFKRDFELTCNQNHLTYKYIGEYDGAKVAILDILNNESFSIIFPFINLISSMEDLVFWSIRKDGFTVDNRLRQRGIFDLIPVNITFDVDTIVFSLTQSGLVLEVYSNSPFHIVNSLPDFLIPIQLKRIRQLFLQSVFNES